MKANNEARRQHRDLAGRAGAKGGPLSPGEAAALAARFKNDGDREARDRLCEANVGLVRHIAARYRNRYRYGQDFEDLVQAGNMGLVDAIRKFDPDKGAFSSYAALWIRARIHERVREDFRLVKIGSTQAQRTLFDNLNKVRSELEARGLAPDPALIAERLDVKESEVVEMIGRMSHADLSLDAPRGEDDDAWESFIPVEEARSVEDIVSDLRDRARLREAIEIMRVTLDEGEHGARNERKRAILRDRLLSDEPMPLEKIGEEFGVSRECIRQDEVKMLKTIRRLFEQGGSDAAPDPAVPKRRGRGR